MFRFTKCKCKCKNTKLYIFAELNKMAEFFKAVANYVLYLKKVHLVS